MHFAVPVSELKTVAMSTAVSASFHWLWHLDWKSAFRKLRDRLSEPQG